MNPTLKDDPDQFTPFTYPLISELKLPRKLKVCNKEFLDVIISRRSALPSERMSLEGISNVLYLSTRIESTYQDQTGYISTKRTTPSAGARHPIDLLVSPSQAFSRRTLSYYNPIEHSLNELAIDKNRIDDFFNEVDRNLHLEDFCLIWFSIQPNKTASKYHNAESLYWRDTGALLYCFQLVSTYLGYNSCPIGTLAISSFSNLFNEPGLISGGGILLGR